MQRLSSGTARQRSRPERSLLLDTQIWLTALVGAALLLYVCRSRFSSRGAHQSAERLALLVGVHRAFGESDASLRHRAIALSRWPYKADAPDLKWWGRIWARVARRR